MKKGFTLIEILISLSIIGIMATIAGFGINGARESARDAKRRADLQNIRTAFELYYSDCAQYPPPSSGAVPENVNSGDYTSPPIRPAGCPASPNQYVYLSDVPTEPRGATSYMYVRPTLSSYVLCAHLEGEDSSTPVPTNCPTDCGTGDCNFSVSGP